MNQVGEMMNKGAMNNPVDWPSGLSSVSGLSNTPPPSNTYKQMVNTLEYSARNLKTSPLAPLS
jgi:hypothetical protein